MAINAVTAGDVALPFRISAFVKDLNAGCQLLNLKNDSLRRRFDGIKASIPHYILDPTFNPMILV
jgi:hypothetical protein